MLRSLVGSEMCIRDSINGYPSAACRALNRESSPAKDRRSTTVPRNQQDVATVNRTARSRLELRVACDRILNTTPLLIRQRSITRHQIHCKFNGDIALQCTLHYLIVIVIMIKCKQNLRLNSDRHIGLRQLNQFTWYMLQIFSSAG